MIGWEILILEDHLWSVPILGMNKPNFVIKLYFNNLKEHIRVIDPKLQANNG